MRALGFCVSVAHAEYMTRVFNDAGIPARTVTGDTPRRRAGRRAARRFESAEVNVLFTVDVFNEGLDIPDVDTVLFLRPTESSTIFMQQLGRGLRRTQSKAVLTVLDFVGLPPQGVQLLPQVRRSDRTPRQASREGREGGLPVPAVRMPGAAGQADPGGRSGEPQVADRQPLGADRRPASRHQGRLPGRRSSTSSGLELSDILRRGSHSWTKLRQDAGLPTLPGLRARGEAAQAGARVRPRR